MRCTMTITTKSEGMSSSLLDDDSSGVAMWHRHELD